MKHHTRLIRLAAITTCMLAACNMMHAQTTELPLTEAQVEAVIRDPENIKPMISDATANHVVEMLVQVIDELDEREMALAAKRAIVAQLFEITRETRGAAAPGIIARVRRRVNPRLLPTIRRGAAAAFGMPLAPGYPGQ